MGYNNDTVTLYFKRLERQFIKSALNGTIHLERCNPGDGVRYKVVCETDKSQENLSPYLKSREIKIWMDAYHDGIRKARNYA